ncbi:hypothetical protein A0J61_11762, partial [Choanephora cucurbitarum]
LEPLLLSIQQDQSYIGYRSLAPISEQQVKCIAYADDICALIKDSDDYRRLNGHLDAYALVSNARFNQNKTEAFSLNGNPQQHWIALFQRDSIPTYYTKFSPDPFRYLGFQMCYTLVQKKKYQKALVEAVRSGIAVYSQRSLSIRGRVTIMNTLLLSKLWYSLRLLPQNKSPRASFDQLCLPRPEGGLGLLNPSKQALVLQMKWLFPLFSVARSNVKEM